MNTIVVRYRCEPDSADQNQRLVEDVFAELAESDPDGIRYATWRLSDDTFIHIAEVEGDNPLTSIAAFAAFQDGLPARCRDSEGPNPQQGALVGSYNFDLTD